MRRAVMLTLLIILSSILLGSRVYPKVTRIEVSGAEHYSDEEVLRLARLSPGDPFLWVTSSKIRRLVRDPWILGVRVIRHWPDTISLTLWERWPVATDGERVWAMDGTVLPDASEPKASLVQIDGWGDDRTSEALELLRLLAEYRPEMLSYSPNGFHIRLANTELFTPNVAALKEHWAGFISGRGSKVAIYPWGVSIKP